MSNEAYMTMIYADSALHECGATHPPRSWYNEPEDAPDFEPDEDFDTDEPDAYDEAHNAPLDAPMEDGRDIFDHCDDLTRAIFGKEF